MDRTARPAPRRSGRLRLTVCRHRSSSFDAVVGALTQIDIKPPWLTKQGFVAGAAAAIAVAGGLALAIRLRFHIHAPQQRARWLPFHQQAADELGSNLLGRAGEEGLGKG